MRRSKRALPRLIKLAALKTPFFKIFIHRVSQHNEFRVRLPRYTRIVELAFEIAFQGGTWVGVGPVYEGVRPPTSWVLSGSYFTISITTRMTITTPDAMNGRDQCSGYFGVREASLEGEDDGHFVYDFLDGHLVA